MKMLSISEACARLGVGRTTIYALASDDFIPIRKIGRRSVIREDELVQAIERLPLASRKVATR